MQLDHELSGPEPMHPLLIVGIQGFWGVVLIPLLLIPGPLMPGLVVSKWRRVVERAFRNPISCSLFFSAVLQLLFLGSSYYCEAFVLSIPYIGSGRSMFEDISAGASLIVSDFAVRSPSFCAFFSLSRRHSDLCFQYKGLGGLILCAYLCVFMNHSSELL